MKKPRLALVANAIILLFIVSSCHKKDSITTEPVPDPPRIISFSPQSGSADTVVTIFGNNFTNDKSKLTVKFGNTPATEIITAATDKITVKVPKQAAPGSVKLSVIVSGNETVASGEFVIDANAWNKLYGGIKNDQAAAVVRTPDGGYVSAGQTFNDSKGSGDILVIKTDAQGNKVWQKTFGGQDYEYGSGIAVAADGSIIVSANTESNNTGDVGANHGANDVWILKLGAGGDLLWQKTFGGTAGDFSSAVTATGDGNFVFTGKTASNSTGDVGANKGSNDLWIVKIDPSGNLLWQKTFGGNAQDEARSLAGLADGSVVVAGMTSSNNSGDVGATNGNFDMWILKLGAQGNLQWKKSFGGDGSDIAYSVAGTADGGYIVGGTTGSSSNNGDVGQNHGAYDMWLVKLGADGNLQWQKTYGGNNGEFAFALCPGPGGSIIAAGMTTTNNNGDVGTTHGAEDIWIIKTSSTGELLGQMVMGGANDDEAAAIIQAPGQGYVIAGYTASNNTGDVGVSNGSYDVWMFRIKDI